MSKMRVHEYAKTVDKESKEIINILKNNGVEVKNHMSTIDDPEINILNKTFKQTPKAQPQPQVSSQEKSAPKEQPVKKVVSQVVNSQDNRQGRSDDTRKPVSSVYNPQNRSNNGGNRDNNGGNRPYNNNGQGGNSNYRPYNRDNNGQGQGSQGQGGNSNYRPYNRDNNSQGQGSQGQGGNSNYRPYNRDNNGQGGQSQGGNSNYRPYNNNGQGGQGQGGNSNYRPYNRDNNSQSGQSQGGNSNYRPYNNNGQGGQSQGGNSNYRPYNRDNNGQGQGGNSNYRPYSNNGQGQSRPYNSNGNGGGYNSGNRDNNGQSRPYNNNGQGGNRPYNNNGQGGNRPYNNNGGNRPYNRDNNGGGYNKDSNDSRGNFNRGGRSNDSKSSGSSDFIIASKPEARKPEARRNDNRNGAQKNRTMDERENLKFANSRPGQFIKPKRVEEKVEDDIKTIILPDVLTIKELADKMKLQPSALVKKLFLQGKVVTINQEIDYETAEEIALEYEILCEHEVKIDVIAELLKEDEEDEANLVKRPPVVCVMGHVDHGKTSLLDAIRSTNVTARESGGITQHIGAYTVEVKGEKITFLDTPGHEAFTAMRMRGAKSTDIAILVVAADDGVMPQTIEAINHAKAAGIEIIVAINKIDKPNANIERVKQELIEYELVAEDWGGSTIFVPVSAHTKEGIDTLLEMINLTAEIHELKANPDRLARGLVIEAELDKGRGPVATILVQKGTLKVGDNIAAGSCYGKIRAMIDDKGNRVIKAGPSTPVEILGLNDVPNAGEIIVATETDKEARTFAETFIREGREKLLDETKAKLSLDDLFSQIQAGNLKELGIIVKADVQGSVEAVKQSLLKITNEEVVVKIIHAGVGNINESDVILASASNAIIIGFNVRPDNQARMIAEREKVDLRLYKVIYDAIQDVETAMKGMLAPKYEEKVIGHLVVRQTFRSSGVGIIAGAYVSDGRITKDSSVRITRGGDMIFEGALTSLKRFKDDAKEVKEGFECGLVFDGFQGAQEDDMIEAYIMVEIPR